MQPHWNNLRVYSFIFLSFFLFLCNNRCEGRIKLPPNLIVRAVFAFGDSIVDQGNNNDLKTLVKCNFPPYGKDFPGAVPTGRFSNAKTPADLVADELGIKEILPAYLDKNLQDKDIPTGVSFASGATGYDPQTGQLMQVITLDKQLEYFKEYVEKLKRIVGEEEAKDIMKNSLNLVVAGSDDLANTYFTVGARRLQYDVDSYTDLMVSSASSFIQDLYKAGLRKFAVFGIPPIGCLPMQRTLGGGYGRTCAESYNIAAQLTNTKLIAKTKSLAKQLPESRVVYIDIYNPLMDLIQNPQNYGFDVVDKGCCGTGNLEVVILCNKYSGTCQDDSKYLFWDSFHPTDRGYRILMDMILKKYVNYFL